MRACRPLVSHVRGRGEYPVRPRLQCVRRLRDPTMNASTRAHTPSPFILWAAIRFEQREVTTAAQMLTLQTLRYQDEILPADDYDLPGSLKAAGVSDKEIRIAARLIDDMTESWTPGKYKDTYRQDLLARVKKKVQSGRTRDVGRIISSSWTGRGKSTSRKPARVFTRMVLERDTRRTGSLRTADRRRARHPPPTFKRRRTACYSTAIPRQACSSTRTSTFCSSGDAPASISSLRAASRPPTC